MVIFISVLGINLWDFRSQFCNNATKKIHSYGHKLLFRLYFYLKIIAKIFIFSVLFRIQVFYILSWIFPLNVGSIVYIWWTQPGAHACAAASLSRRWRTGPEARPRDPGAHVCPYPTYDTRDPQISLPHSLSCVRLTYTSILQSTDKLCFNVLGTSRGMHLWITRGRLWIEIIK